MRKTHLDDYCAGWARSPATCVLRLEKVLKTEVVGQSLHHDDPTSSRARAVHLNMTDFRLAAQPQGLRQMAKKQPACSAIHQQNGTMFSW